MTRRQTSAARQRQPASETQHGTLSGYQNHGCRCRDCRTANREYFVQYRKAKRRADIPTTLKHGTDYARYTYGCDCAECRPPGARLRAR